MSHFLCPPSFLLQCPSESNRVSAAAPLVVGSSTPRCQPGGSSDSRRVERDRDRVLEDTWEVGTGQRHCHLVGLLGGGETQLVVGWTLRRWTEILTLGLRNSATKGDIWVAKTGSARGKET